MPVSPTYPGVYIEEVPSGVHTITGVSTSIAAFFGRTTKGPIDKAVRCFNYSDFTRTFGSGHPASALAQNLRLFFDNGGTDCYVIRLAKDAEKADVTLRSLGDDQVLVARAKAEGAWGDTVRLKVDYNTPNPDETFNLQVIHEEGGRVVTTESHKNLSMHPSSPRFAPAFVTGSSGLIELELYSGLGPPMDSTSDYNNLLYSFVGFSQARRPLGTLPDARIALEPLLNAPAASDLKTQFNISVNDSAYVTVDLGRYATVSTATWTNILDRFADRINSALSALSPAPTVVCRRNTAQNYLTIIPTNGDRSSVRIRRASSNDIAAALMMGIDQGGIEPVRYSSFRPAPNGSFLQLGTVPSTTSPSIDPTGADPSAPNYPNTLTQTLNDIAASIEQDDITAIDIEGGSVALDTATYNLVTTNDTDPWYLNKPIADSPHENHDGVREKLRIMAQAITNDSGVPYEAEAWGYHLTITPTGGTINTLPSSISTTVAYFDDGVVRNTKLYTLGATGASDYCIPGQPGHDGTYPTKNEYVGDTVRQTGFHALDPVDIFNLMVLPADEEVNLTDIWGPASTYCNEKRAFLLMDAPPDWTDPNTGLAAVVQNTSWVGDLRATVTNINSAVFYPRLRYKENGVPKLIGPAGAVAGLMARTDATRGVWKAPAGIESDLRNILGLEVKLTDMENGVLNKLAVNCLREFPGSFVCWGSRTMDGYDDKSSEWKYIPIRRLALFLEESLFRGTKWVVFEPNDEPLWAKIRLNVGAFMMRLFRQGAFQGSTPEKAFYVKCDEETTPQADRDLGIVNIEVGFAPLKPAEFVIIKIQQMAGEL